MPKRKSGNQTNKTPNDQTKIETIKSKYNEACFNSQV